MRKLALSDEILMKVDKAARYIGKRQLGSGTRKLYRGLHYGAEMLALNFRKECTIQS